MNRLRYRPGTWTPYASHIDFMNDGVDSAFRAVLSDYIQLNPDFFISGADISQTPSGTSTNVAITDGFLVYKGEVISVEAHSIVKLASQVVYIQLQDDGVDITPVPNLDGNADFVMRKRHARLRVGPVYPTEHMAITAPRKAQLDRLRLKGRIVIPGMILPYSGSLGEFDGTGLGIANGPMDGWAVCNGLNGTPDLRGMTLLGATAVPDSGAPELYAGVEGETVPGAKVGADAIALTPNHLPEHKHPLGMPSNSYWSAGGGAVNVSNPGTGDSTQVFPTDTGDNTTLNTPLDMRQSSYGVVFIMSIVA